jgi:hypothetical protein
VDPATYVPPFVDRIQLTITQDGETKYKATNDKDDAGQISNNFDRVPELDYGVYQLSIDCHTCPTGGTKPHYRDCPEGSWNLTHFPKLDSLTISPSNLSGEVVVNLETNSGVALEDTPITISSNLTGVISNDISVDSNGNFVVCKPNYSLVDSNAGWIDVYIYDSHGGEPIATAKTKEVPLVVSSTEFCRLSGNTVYSAYIFDPTPLVANDPNTLAISAINFEQNGAWTADETDIESLPDVSLPGSVIDANNNFVVVAWSETIVTIPTRKVYFRTYNRDLTPISEVKEINCNDSENCFEPKIKIVAPDKFAILFTNYLNPITRVGGQIFNSDGSPTTPNGKILSPAGINIHLFSFDTAGEDKIAFYFDTNDESRGIGVLNYAMNWIKQPLSFISFSGVNGELQALPAGGKINYYMNDQIIMSWKEGTSINFAPINSDLVGEQIRTPVPNASTSPFYYISVNEDGFGVVAWQGQAFEPLRFQRVLF